MVCVPQSRHGSGQKRLARATRAESRDAPDLARDAGRAPRGPVRCLLKPPSELAALLIAALLVALAGCRSANESQTPPPQDERLEAPAVGSEGPAAPGDVGESAEGEEPGEFDEFDEFEEFEDPNQADEVFDPLSGYNRVMFHFNDKFYLWVWRPVAKGYAFVLPEVARVALQRAYDNFKTPARFGNSLLQLKFKKAGLELGRLLVNSTIGIGGLFDPADKLFGWTEPSPEDFGQTLGFYGVGGGFPFVLPFLGPSNVRDGFGLIPDTFADPLAYFIPFYATVGIAAGGQFNRSSLHLGEYESLKKDALDPYTFFRDAYEQSREEKIKE